MPRPQCIRPRSLVDGCVHRSRESFLSETLYQPCSVTVYRRDGLPRGVLCYVDAQIWHGMAWFEVLLPKCTASHLLV